MQREILLTVLDQQFDDPMALIGTSQSERAATSTYSRRYPLKWDPPPDTSFMRATGLDMGVFGETLEYGSLQMIESRHTSPGLEAALGRDRERTIAALVGFANHSVSADEVAAALDTGRWAAEDMQQRGAVLQAAGFARCLLDAIRFAVPDRRAVVWEYRSSERMSAAHDRKPRAAVQQAELEARQAKAESIDADLLIAELLDQQ